MSTSDTELALVCERACTCNTQEETRAHVSVRTNHRNYSTKLSTPKILLKNNTHQGGHAFGNLKGEASASFNSMGMEINYRRGAAVFAEGQLPQCVFVVHSGRIKLSVTSREGKTMILRIAEKI